MVMLREMLSRMLCVLLMLAMHGSLGSDVQSVINAHTRVELGLLVGTNVDIVAPATSEFAVLAASLGDVRWFMLPCWA